MVSVVVTYVIQHLLGGFTITFSIITILFIHFVADLSVPGILLGWGCRNEELVVREEAGTVLTRMTAGRKDVCLESRGGSCSQASWGHWENSQRGWLLRRVSGPVRVSPDS